MKIIYLTFLIVIGNFILGCKKGNNDDSSGSGDKNQPPVKLAGNRITSFDVSVFGQTVHANGIDTINNKITFTLPPNPGVDPGLMTPSIKISDKASIIPGPTTPQDFIQGITYTVTAENNVSRKILVQALPAANNPPAPAAPQPLMIYYGIPTLVNGSSSVAQAAAFFSKFKVIVFGNHLNDLSSPWRNITSQLIFAIRGIDPTIKIYGYVDLGNTEHLSLAALHASVDNWYSMGAHGVFLDEFDYDFGNDRNRQNDVIDYIHSRTLSVFVNSYTVDDALADYNGAPTHLNNQDLELLESLLVKWGTATPLTEFYQRANKAYIYMRTKGVRIAVAATIQLANLNSSSNTSDLYKLAWCGSAMYSFPFFQFTDLNYSATPGSATYYYPPLTTNPGTTFSPQFDWVKQGSDEYFRSTNSGTLHVYANGKGAFTN